MIGESIADEFWFQDLWGITVARPLRLRGKHGPEILSENRDQPLYPFVVLARVPDTEDEAREIAPQLNRIAVSRPDLELLLWSNRPELWKDVPFPVREAGEDEEFARARFAIVLTAHEPAARDLASFFHGPIYSLPEVAPASHPNWTRVRLKPGEDPKNQWPIFLRRVGLHDPPLEPVYV